MNKTQKYLPVEGHNGLVRDSFSGAILNVDKDARVEHKRKRELVKREKLAVLRKDQEINTLKKEVADIKSMLAAVLEQLKNGNN